MNELRLTFSSEGFAAVSQLLVDMGLSFRVEPVAAAKEEAAPTLGNAPTPVKAARQRAAKTKKLAHAAKPPTSGDAVVPGAERLRAAIARGGSAYRSLTDSPTIPTAPAGSGGDAPTGQPSERNGD